MLTLQCPAIVDANSSTSLVADLQEEYANGSLTDVEFVWTFPDGSQQQGASVSQLISERTEVNVSACYDPFASLNNRVEWTLSDRHRMGFGRAATGGTNQFKIVTNPAPTGPGTFEDILKNAQSGDFIIFDPSSSVTTYDVFWSNNNDARPPANVTICGALPNGQFVTLRSRNTDFRSVIRWSNGNGIMRNIYIDNDQNQATAIGAGTGQNYWFDNFGIHAPSLDDTLGFGLPNSTNPAQRQDSADLITVSRYKVIDLAGARAAKGAVMNMDGPSCASNPDYDPAVHGYDATDQREGRITFLKTEFAAQERNPSVSGGMAHLIQCWLHDTPAGSRLSGLVVRRGGQAIVECSYLDLVDTVVSASGIRADDGTFVTPANPAARPAACPEAGQIFLDGNIYRQITNNSWSTTPLIGSGNITTGGNGEIIEGKANWSSANVQPFNIDYDYQEWLDKPLTPNNIDIEAGPDFDSSDICSTAMCTINVRNDPDPTLSCENSLWN
ncbi:hypothetical protein AB833_19430 [Chromatiales bacterium (ex Bugula neritina AB1)]|nr:hypothetical protein AB833_19430 [Chromatiales bacterium (ex Bugula neritina AB1)]